MSKKETKTNGQALSGELTANGLLNLFSYEPPKYKIPVKHKYTGSRKALRKLKKARKHGK